MGVGGVENGVPGSGGPLPPALRRDTFCSRMWPWQLEVPWKRVVTFPWSLRNNSWVSCPWPGLLNVQNLKGKNKVKSLPSRGVGLLCSWEVIELASLLVYVPCLRSKKKKRQQDQKQHLHIYTLTEFLSCLTFIECICGRRRICSFKAFLHIFSRKKNSR